MCTLRPSITSSYLTAPSPPRDPQNRKLSALGHHTLGTTASGVSETFSWPSSPTLLGCEKSVLSFGSENSYHLEVLLLSDISMFVQITRQPLSFMFEQLIKPHISETLGQGLRRNCKKLEGFIFLAYCLDGSLLFSFLSPSFPHCPLHIVFRLLLSEGPSEVRALRLSTTALLDTVIY